MTEKKSKAVLIAVSLLLVTTSLLSFNRTQLKRKLVKAYGSVVKNEQVIPTNNMPFVWGIDISHHQRNVDWKLLSEKNKPQFMYLKATEGKTFQDPKYLEYQSDARYLNIPVGGYHFFSYQTNGKAQAKNFIMNSNTQKGDLYPVLDLEFKKNMKDKKWIVHQVHNFCETIKKRYGVYPIIYCEYDYYKKYLEDDFSDYQYWICDFHREPSFNYTIWQYTDKEYVQGIGKIDNNRLNKNKNISNIIL